MMRKPPPEPLVHGSLGLQALCHRLRHVTTCDILELGPARSGNIEFWSRFSPSIYVADLRSSLPLPLAALPSEDAESVTPDWNRILKLPGTNCYDVILTWDLLNYLELPAVSSLTDYLKRFCRPETVLFSMIFDQKQMPDEITVYRITDESHLKYEYAGSEMRVCPRHQPRALAGAMTRFHISDSFRLRNGVVEYLFEYEGDNQDSI